MFQPDMNSPLMFLHAHVDRSFGFTDVYFPARISKYILYSTEWKSLSLRISQDLFDLLWKLEGGSDVVFVRGPAEIRSVVIFTHEREASSCSLLCVLFFFLFYILLVFVPL